MSKSEPYIDLWAIPILMLWAIFFSVGLLPQVAFLLLRYAGLVLTQQALVNTPAFITLVLSGYLGWFTYKRCIESNLTPTEAYSRALCVMIVGVVAFWDYPIFLMFYMPEMLGRFDRYVNYFIGGGKIVAWLFLMSLVLRYHAFGESDVFRNLLPVQKERRKTDEIRDSFSSDKGPHVE